MGFAHFSVINQNFLEALRKNYSNLKTTRTSVLKCAPHQMQARLITSVSVCTFILIIILYKDKNRRSRSGGGGCCGRRRGRCGSGGGGSGGGGGGGSGGGGGNNSVHSNIYAIVNQFHDKI